MIERKTRLHRYASLVAATVFALLMLLMWQLSAHAQAAPFAGETPPAASQTLEG